MQNTNTVDPIRCRYENNENIDFIYHRATHNHHIISHQHIMLGICLIAYTLIVFVLTIYLTKVYSLADSYWYNIVIDLVYYAIDFIDRGARGFTFR